MLFYNGTDSRLRQSSTNFESCTTGLRPCRLRMTKSIGMHHTAASFISMSSLLNSELVMSQLISDPSCKRDISSDIHRTIITCHSHMYACWFTIFKKHLQRLMKILIFGCASLTGGISMSMTLCASLTGGICMSMTCMSMTYIYLENST